ncbi:MAG: glycosyltransferase family A protein [Rubrivivax sp.]|nr:glycosyltransferase family A protein [Rubrivivax sp.]
MNPTPTQATPPGKGLVDQLIGAWPVMVLAHNEERHIEACLDSIFAADPDRRFEVYVMANGCTDRTEAIVSNYGRKRPEVHLVSIQMGDKCNAWNVFIHETIKASCPGRDIYFFMDGDATAEAGAFKAMSLGLDRVPHANAAAAVPLTGRNAARDREAMVQEHALVANLYALRGSFVDRLQVQGVRVPLKLEGDDGMIGAFVKWDLAPTTNGTDDKRIVVCPDAGFRFESFKPTRLSDWKVYWKRAVRYGRRNYEFRLLGPLIETQGMGAVPRDVQDIYRQAEGLTLRWQGPYTLTNWVALRQMRRIGRQRST